MPLSDLVQQWVAHQECPASPVPEGLDTDPSSRRQTPSNSGSNHSDDNDDDNDSSSSVSRDSAASGSQRLRTNAELLKLKRQQQTANARAQALLARHKRRLDAGPMELPQLDPDTASRASFQQANLAGKQAGHLWWNVFEEVPARGSTSSRQQKDSNRRRAVWLYFCNLAKALQGLFLSACRSSDSNAEQCISHVVSINTCDDSNVKMLADDGSSVEVRGVMCNIQQHLVVRNELAEDEVPTWFVLHQPLVALHRATATHLSQQFLSWVLCFCGKVGRRLAFWGVPDGLFQSVGQHAFIFVSDALRANDAVFRELCQKVRHHATHDGSPATVALQVHCSIHQVSLIRRTVVLGFEGYWSNLVRLGHLFESHSFRQRFHAAMATVVHESFDYLRVDELPSDMVTWKQEAIKRLRMASALPKRLKRLMHHLQIDNGCHDTDRICHWCVGPSCCEGGEQEALSKLIASFRSLLDRTVVPLLYRWKHAPDANHFVRDGFFFHRILPRTLEAIPTVKGVLGHIRTKIFLGLGWSRYVAVH